MLKNTTTLMVTLGLLVAPVLIGGPRVPPNRPNPPCARNCAAPEPSAIPELALCLAGISAGYWFLRRSKKPVS